MASNASNASTTVEQIKADSQWAEDMRAQLATAQRDLNEANALLKRLHDEPHAVFISMQLGHVAQISRQQFEQLSGGRVDER